MADRNSGGLPQADFINFSNSGNANNHPSSSSRAGPSSSRAHTHASSTSDSARRGKRKADEATPPAAPTKKKKKKSKSKKGKGAASEDAQSSKDGSKAASVGKPPKPKAKDRDGPSGSSRPSSSTSSRAGGYGAGGGGGGRAYRGPQGQKPRGIDAPMTKKVEQQAAEKHAPWTDLVDLGEVHDSIDLLNQEIAAFYKYVSPTPEEFEVRLFVIEWITRSIVGLWPDAEITPFGSWLTQLYLPQGDIDIVVSTKQFSQSNRVRLLTEMAGCIRRNKIAHQVVILSNAKVPIIKFVTLIGNINVDISLNQVNGISANQIINQYLDALPGARQLILVVKYFLSQRSMNEVFTGGLGSYSVICLVISFMQVHPKLRRSEMNPEANLGTLLVEFFELYGRNFNYDEVGVSIRRGGFYYLKASRGWMKNQPFLLSIEDPQDNNNDISGGSFGIRSVKNVLGGAFEILCKNLFERAEELAGIQSGRLPGFRQDDGDQWSILNGVMGITKEVLKKREELIKVHQNGTLHTLLNIPRNADPSKYVRNYRPPPTVRSPPRVSGRGGAGPGRTAVGAIEVDDDEVGSDSDSDSGDEESSSSSSSSGSGSSGSDGESDGVIALSTPPPPRPRRRPVSPPISDPEDGEIVPLPGLSSHLNGKRPGSLPSEDGEDGIEMLDSPPEESRYAFSSKTDKHRAKRLGAAAAAASAPNGDDDDGDDSDDSDARKLAEIMNAPSESSSIVGDSSDDAEREQRQRGQRSRSGSGISKSNNGGKEDKTTRKERRDKKRAFWAAKGGAGSGVGAGEEDELEDD
ncbi:hypothetical protein IAT38_002531 [Cryptococcus sp. DSM 104549]